MTPQLIAACTGSTLALAELYAPHLKFAMDAYEINDPKRASMFLPNIGVESMHLARTLENLNYRVEALISKFGRHRISIEDANKYGRIDGKQAANQQAIANCIYGGTWGAERLGNTRAGDGWKFRGHALIQTTGRFNTAAVRNRLRHKFPGLKVPDFEENPDALCEPLWAALSAADYWDMRELNLWADRGDFDGVCDLINMGKKTDKFGDAMGFEERSNQYRSAKVALRLI